jgi:hypothetical protein
MWTEYLDRKSYITPRQLSRMGADNEGCPSRRNVLKTVGAGFTVAAGSKTVTATSSLSVSDLVYVTKGSKESPVSVDEIEEATERVLANGATVHDAEEVITNNARAEQRVFEQDSDSHAKDIIGYGVAWTGDSPKIEIHRLPRHAPIDGAKVSTRRAHEKLDQFANSPSSNRVSTDFSPSDDWKKLGSVSDDTWVFGGGSAENKVGFIEHFTEAYKNTDERKPSTNDYAVTQKGDTLPACDNSWGESAVNAGTKQIQNWGRSDLTPVDHLDHQPTKDVTTSIDTQLTASYGGGSISVSVNIPYISRNVEYVADEQARTFYNYPPKIDDPFNAGAKKSNCDHEQVGIWRTDPISSDSADITSSYYLGKFRNRGGVSYADNTFTLLTLNKLQ